MNYNLALPLHRNSIESPDRLALSADGEELTYRELATLARRVACVLATTLAPGIQHERQWRVGILASRSIEACIGVLGAAWSGATYVPLGSRLPEERLRTVLSLCHLDALITDAEGARLLSERVLEACPNLLLVPDPAVLKKTPAMRGKWLHGLRALPDARALDAPAHVSADDLAYIEFTSGTTGVPKGVMISAGAVHHYLTMMMDRYRFTPEDRLPETCELNFDVSVHDMFLTWGAGASLHVLPRNQIMNSVRFIRDKQLTVWVSVPSIIGLAQRTRALRPGVLPSLRCSMFGGESLSVAAARAWAEAAPNSVIDNLYGPTEATVTCTALCYSTHPIQTPGRDVIAIGMPLPGTQVAIVDESLNFLAPGQDGELAISGPQLARGYLGEPELTESRFPTINGKRWYLTGDLARRDEAGCLHHLGRVDHQVKILGHRVELEEVEAHLRVVTQAGFVAALAWPIQGAAQGIVAFVSGEMPPVRDVLARMAQRLPEYMVPHRIERLSDMPLSPNGKVDRKQLRGLLEEESR
ncbi:amino acid adenylation domain-containing protein [Archangium violaceum]|uniref:amino acid adenylation domain-containing protein n=1 Tax=Archangium violaceum TaxID=83451 RepID=UPI001950AB3A|nr:amino acid adenylation domain-containing protein [Archangium violaceum]QRN95838.1 amino acid adenylation domain-containing protein [Archangium violaceum]